jgi:hypothetical protein
MRKERQLARSTRRKSFLPKPFAGTGGRIVEGKGNAEQQQMQQQKISNF